MESVLSIATMKTVLARYIDVKDTLDYAVFGISEPPLWMQFLLLGPIFSWIKSHKYFLGVTTSGILIVEVNAKFAEKQHRFIKYYEIDRIETDPALKGKRLTIFLKDNEIRQMVFPKVVHGLSSHEKEIESALRVIEEKIRASKEYFRNLKRKNKSPRRSSMNRRTPQRRKNYPGRRRSPSENR